MRNILEEAKKTFKSRLKNNKKVYYSTGMVISYLLTGGFSQSEPIIKSGEVKIAKINETLEEQVERLQIEIRKRRQDNGKKLNIYSTELAALENEGDQIVKSPWESFMTLGMFEYNRMKKYEMAECEK